MSKKIFLVRFLSLLVVVMIVVPATFFVAPQRVSADSGGCVGGLLGTAGASFGLSAASKIASVPVSDSADTLVNSGTAGATIGTCINELVFVPLARAAIRSILQQMTASVIDAITGKSNGTGAPQFTTNLAKTLQLVSDARVLSYTRQIGLTNSPFASSIGMALNSNYLQGSSLAGFWASNLCTLSGSSSNINSYLAGKWSQGGVGAWFALTTQPQNNPYMLYQRSQDQLASVVTSATAARTTELNWGGGFLSWCGASDVSTADASGQGGGINPGDACTKDGVSGTIQTPGSIIHDYTQKAVVSSGFDQLIAANDLDSAFSSVINALMTTVLGKARGGLLGASQISSSGQSSIVTQLQNYSGASTNATQTAFGTVQSILSQISIYIAAWNTITAAANTAQTSLTTLSNVCTTNANTAAQALIGFGGTYPLGTPLDQIHSTFIDAARAQAAAVAAVPAIKISPVLAQAQTQISSVAATQAFALKVEAEATPSNPSPSLAVDVATLVAMPPSVIDVVSVQSNATVGNSATAVPTGSLTVSNGTLIDQMNLISTNATTLQTTVCDSNSSLYNVGNNSGGGSR